MSRTYRLLGLTLAVVGALVLVAQLIERSNGGSTTSAAAGGTTVAPNDLMPAMSAASTSAPAPGASAVPASQPVSAPADCTVAETLQMGATGDAVACIEAKLVAAGLLASADAVFDAATDAAVRSFQTSQGLEVDGIFGRKSAQAMGIWSGPDGPAPASDADCPDTAHGAIVDRARQRGALCDGGRISYEFPLTSAWAQPDPGTYPVYAKDLKASSTFGGHYSTMTHFVAFTKGKFTGARVAFHSVPTLTNGDYVQPLDSVGTEQFHGASSGCIRVLPDDAVKIWDWLAKGDKVHVIS